VLEAVNFHNEGAPFPESYFIPGESADSLYRLMIHGVTSFNVSGYSAKATIKPAVSFSRGAVAGRVARIR